MYISGGGQAVSHPVEACGCDGRLDEGGGGGRCCRGGGIVVGGRGGLFAYVGVIHRW